VQTYTPFSLRFSSAAPSRFALVIFNKNGSFRERCDFRPFKHAILITVRIEHEANASFPRETLARRLKRRLPENSIGRTRAGAIAKLQGQYR